MWLIEAIDGDWTNVVGLPVFELDAASGLPSPCRRFRPSTRIRVIEGSQAMTDPKPAGEPSDLVECVQEVVDDIGQFLEWSRLAGAEALPADGRLPADERTALLKAPMAPVRGASAQASGSQATERRGSEASVRSAPRGGTSSPQQPALGNWGAFVRSPSDTPTVGALDRAETLDAVWAEPGDCQRCVPWPTQHRVWCGF